MRWFAVALSLLAFSFTGCTQFEVPQANPYQYSAAEDGDKTLHFYNNTGLHVRVVTDPGGSYVGKASSGWNCFDLNVVESVTQGFIFEVTASRGVSTRYNSDQPILGRNWTASLGPNPNVWQYDLMLSFKPRTQPCR